MSSAEASKGPNISQDMEAGIKEQKSLKLLHLSSVLEICLYLIRYTSRQDLEYFPNITLSVQGRALSFLFDSGDNLPSFSIF